MKIFLTIMASIFVASHLYDAFFKQNAWDMGYLILGLFVLFVKCIDKEDVREAWKYSDYKSSAYFTYVVFVNVVAFWPYYIIFRNSISKDPYI